MLSEFQKQKWIHFFNILDFNKNGKITIEDFIAIAENLCVLWGVREGDEEYKEIMTKCKNSWVSFTNAIPEDMVMEVHRNQVLLLADEFIGGDGKHFEEYVSHFVGEIFSQFDINNDGYISLDEYVDLFMAYHIEIRYSAKSFTKLDLNGDDMLSRDELVAAVRQYFIGDNKEERGNWLFGFWNV
ncbi:MAG: EF-hand domain-containing protein [Cyclobacteriaceae bacterium]